MTKKETTESSAAPPPLSPVRLPNGTLVLMGVKAKDFDDALEQLLEVVKKEHDADDAYWEEIADVFEQHADRGPDLMMDSVAIVTERIKSPGPDLQALVRFDPPMQMRDDTGQPTNFLWVLISHQETHPAMDVAAEFKHLMHEPEPRARILAAKTAEELSAAYEKGESDEAHLASHHIPPELERTGRFAGGIVKDIKRRAPSYVSDFTDGFTTKTLASTIFLYFACLAPAIAFGGLLSVLTEGSIGAIEMILSTAVCGVTYALLSGQPLTILGSTGPVIIFMGILYQVTEYFGVPYMPTLAWVGLWTTLFLVILAVTDACSWIRYFTRFTDDTFAALISIIFIVEALKDVGQAFTEADVSEATALFQLVLAIGTFYVATNLSRIRRSNFLLRPIREFLADFGPTIAIACMALIAYTLPDVPIETLAVPDTFEPTSERSWFVNPLDAPVWVWGAAAGPALLVSILLYLDQNITVRLVNNPEFKLKKGAGYHLDLLIVGLLVALCSLFGLPWMVAATVRSLNHVRSLVKIDPDSGSKETITGVVETRMTGVLVHGLVGVSLLFLGVLQLVPMSVLFGLFLFMGVASMKGNQLFERLQLWFMDPNRYPADYYLRVVPRGVVHKFTAIQAACLVVLWTVKASALGILFPLFIALLVPVRMFIERFFKAEHLALLDAEEQPEEEEHREVT